MILIDTNVVIDYWRNSTREVGLAIKQLDPCVCGVVLAELLQGTANEWDVAWTRRALSKFRWLEMRSDMWRYLGLNLAALRRAGLVIPFPDVLLATMAIVYGAPVWSKDKHFALMQQVLPALQLYNPETES
jgi:predicted nucleic acid-binding protein